jgi:hypothetical protein
VSTPTCGHDAQLRRGAYSVLLAIARSSPEHASHIASSLSNKHVLGDIDIIGQKKNKKKKIVHNLVTFEQYLPITMKKKLMIIG